MSTKLERTHRKDSGMAMTPLAELIRTIHLGEIQMTFETIKIMLDEAIMDGVIRSYNYTCVNGQELFYVMDNDDNQRVVKVSE